MNLDKHTLSFYIAKKGLFSSLPISDPNTEKELGAEIKMFRSVIDLALCDSARHPSPFQLRNQTALKALEDIKKDAKEWFNIKDKDFLLVCQLADLNPVVVLRVQKKIEPMLQKTLTVSEALDILKLKE